MITFDVYQQFPPIKLGEKDADGNDLYAANLIHVGRVEAMNTKDADTKAREMPRFRILSGLGRFPILEDKELIKRQEQQALAAAYDREAA